MASPWWLTRSRLCDVKGSKASTCAGAGKAPARLGNLERPPEQPSSRAAHSPAGDVFDEHLTSLGDGVQLTLGSKAVLETSPHRNSGDIPFSRFRIDCPDFATTGMLESLRVALPHVRPGPLLVCHRLRQLYRLFSSSKGGREAHPDFCVHSARLRGHHLPPQRHIHSCCVS